MQEVHTSTRLTVPLTMARTRWMLGFQRRLVRRCEWLMLMPNEGCLPHTSHTDAMTRLPPREIAGERSRLASPPMATLERLGPDDLKSVVTAYRDALRAHQGPINRLNVYPVP